MSKVEIFHNIAPNGAGFFGFNSVLIEGGGKRDAATDDERHPLVKVYEYQTEGPERPSYADDLRICEGAFAMFNNGSGQEDGRYFGRRLRSLSTGDVVVVDGQAYSCESAGWKERDRAELAIVDDYPFPDAAPRDGAHRIITVPWVEVPFDNRGRRQTFAFRTLMAAVPEAFDQPPGNALPISAAFVPALRLWYDGGQQVELVELARQWWAEHKDHGPVHLIGVGDVPGVPARELAVGDALMWNYGATYVVDEIRDVSPQYIQIIEHPSGKPVAQTPRRLKKDRLVARVARAGE